MQSRIYNWSKISLHLQWICSGRPITICAIASEWLDMPGVSGLASAWGHEGTKSNQGSHIIYITEKPVRKHAQSCLRAQLLGYWFRLACSGWPAGLKSACFYSSKEEVTIIKFPNSLIQMTLNTKISTSLTCAPASSEQAQIMTFGIACSGWPVGFISTCFYLI